jgi:hypothetical protein
MKLKHLVSLLTALCLGSAGCSFAFVKPPRAADPIARTPAAADGCTTAPLAPLLDGLFAGYQVVRTLVAINASDSAYEKAAISRSADVSIGLGLTVLGIVSLAYGAGHVSACQTLVDAEQARAERLRGLEHEEPHAVSDEMTRKLREQQVARTAASPGPGEVSAP